MRWRGATSNPFRLLRQRYRRDGGNLTTISLVSPVNTGVKAKPSICAKGRGRQMFLRCVLRGGITKQSNQQSPAIIAAAIFLGGCFPTST